MGDMGDPPKKKRLISLCVGCGNQIHDQYILRVSPDLEWHAACLKCAECNQYLDETCTCFVRDGKTYCKRDYIRYAIYGGWLRRARWEPRDCAVLVTRVGAFSHLRMGELSPSPPRETRNPPPTPECNPRNPLFAVWGCQQEVALSLLPEGLSPGSSREPGSEKDEPLQGAGLRQGTDPSASGACGKAVLSTGGSGVRKEIDFITTGEHLGSEPISARQPALRPHVHKQPEKTTRVRTVLNEKQLHTLRTCYAANPRPDALMKEQLVEMTGLSPRVIRVWFQNKRCKDKKRSIMMKQLQQQQPNDKTNIQGMTGTPMVAASPERHDGGLQANPVEVQSYQPPWKVLSDFALQSDIDQPAFQQLVNFSEGGPGSNSTGSEVASMSSQLPDTPNSMVASPIEA
ncbi:PREDICTED: insulin gene enhancer protein ISL-1 [Aptenodytes forsteri]|uniref:insulin gene enhancer protein ISL-1 n=1 Tax=Aptenodytes forsteri TaxID=9233 RepID=UPI0004F46EA8|nr:PREDICTED: insulin gene enhancer protein ISL-1 [Aptenodytes forsteri]